MRKGIIIPTGYSYIFLLTGLPKKYCKDLAFIMFIES